MRADDSHVPFRAPLRAPAAATAAILRPSRPAMLSWCSGVLLAVTPLVGSLSPVRAEQAPETESSASESESAATEAKEQDSEKVAPDPPPGSALEAVVEAMRSLQRGDVDLFVSRFDADPDELAMLTAVAGFARSALAFRQRYVESYGIKYWDAFQNAEDPAGEFDFHFTHVLDSQIEDLKRLDPEALERDGLVRLPNTGADTRVLRDENGRWLIDATPLAPPGANHAAFGRRMDRLSHMVTTYTKLLGRDGIQPRDIDHDMGRAEAEIFHGAPLPDTAPPARLDVDRILAEAGPETNGSPKGAAEPQRSATEDDPRDEAEAEADPRPGEGESGENPAPPSAGDSDRASS